MAHDFKRFPELANSQMQLYYFDSPHKQIVEDFRAYVTKVTDGDTIRVYWQGRDFTFPIRLLDINAPEMNEAGGEEVKEWLKQRIEGKEVDILIDPKQRVGKYGRLLGRVVSGGLEVGLEMRNIGLVTSFEERGEHEIPDINSYFAGSSFNGA